MGDAGARDRSRRCGPSAGVVAVPLHESCTDQSIGGAVGGWDGNGGYFASGTMRRRVMALAERVGFDAVLAFSSSMAPLAMEVRARRRVLDLDDLDSRKWAESVEGAGWRCAGLSNRADRLLA